MKSALTALRTETRELRWHIKAMEIEWELLAASSATPPCSASDGIALKFREHVGLGIAKRRFDYNCVVISLYGYLEQYIESLILAYAETLNTIVPKYEDLPMSIKQSHLSLTFNLIQKANLSKYRGLIDAAALVANLHSCLNNQTSYKINPEAFCYHPTNFRADSVGALFGRVGVQGVTRRLRYFSPFTEYLEQKFPKRDIHTLKDKEIFYYIDDLAERRNEVAHGSPSELLRNDILLEYIECVDAFCGGIFELLDAEISGYLIRYKAIHLGDPINVFNNRIICVELNNLDLYVGDLLIATTGNSGRPYIAGEIQELQIDRVSVSSVPPSPSIQVGMRVGFKAKRNYKYSVVQSPRVQSASASVEEAQDENA